MKQDGRAASGDRGGPFFFAGRPPAGFWGQRGICPASRACRSTSSDVAREIGPDFWNDDGAFGAIWLPETIGSGGGFFDLDGDRLPDMLLVNQTTWDGHGTDVSWTCPAPCKRGENREGRANRPGRWRPPGWTWISTDEWTLALRQATEVRSRTKGSPAASTPISGARGLEDRTGSFGLLSPEAKSLGIAVKDFDDDGWPDLVIANDMARNSLFRNRGDGTFQASRSERVLRTARMGPPVPGWGSMSEI